MVYDVIALLRFSSVMILNATIEKWVIYVQCSSFKEIIQSLKDKFQAFCSYLLVLIFPVGLKNIISAIVSNLLFLPFYCGDKIDTE